MVPIRDNQAVRELYDLSTDIGEKNNVYDEYPEVVARLMETVEAARADLGDTFTGSVGKKIRPIGRVEHARPLTAYDPDHPYIISLYDRNEVG